MREKVYEKYFTGEELSNLKTSETRELQKEESAVTVTALIVMAGLFATFVLLVALILWTNKLTMFLFTVTFLPTLLFNIILARSMKGFKKSIDSYKKTAESRGVK